MNVTVYEKNSDLILLERNNIIDVYMNKHIENGAIFLQDDEGFMFQFMRDEITVKVNID